MKRAFFMLAVLVLALVGVGEAAAGSIPYPNPGTPISGSYTFQASKSGDIVAYKAEINTASYTEVLGLLVNGVDTGITGLNNMGSNPGDSLDFGHVNAGDILTFYINITAPPEAIATVYSDSSLNSAAYGGYSHVYSTDYSQGGGLGSIPSGTYVAFEDLPDAISDWNYHDETFVFTNVSTTSVPPSPEPASMTLLGIGIAGMAGYGWRKRKQKQAATAPEQV